MFGDQFGTRRSRLTLYGAEQFLGVADPNPNNPVAATFGPATLVSRVVQVGNAYNYVNMPAGFLVPAPSGGVNIIPTSPQTGDFPILRSGPGTSPTAPTYLLANNLGLPGLYVALPTSTITPSDHVLYSIRPLSGLTLALPSNGGVVGRTKVADDNNPLPRDRLIFNYDLFNHAAITAGGMDVHRFSVGFEKTFLDSNRASIEVRLPFAATLDTDVVASEDIRTRSTELGNLHLTLKALLYAGCTVNLAMGLGLGLPTAADLRIRTADGLAVLTARNDTVTIEPYAAVLWTPTCRCFAQAWSQLLLNPNSNRVEANLTGSSLTKIGGLYDSSMLLSSAQVGYWVYRNTNVTTLSGVAPFAELHCNASLGGANSIQTDYFQVDTPKSLTELNASFGLATLFGDNFQLMLGASIPLLSGDNHRTFDYQIAIRGNLFFGATAAARSGRWPSSF